MEATSEEEVEVQGFPDLVESQILAVIGPGGGQFMITPSDKVTQYDIPVLFESVMGILSTTDQHLDLWVTDEDENKRVFIRLFARNVILLTQSFIFPDEQAQA